jgi:hypothetical protein
MAPLLYKLMRELMLLLNKKVVTWMVMLLQASGDEEVCNKAEQAQVAKENAAAEEARASEEATDAKSDARDKEDDVAMDDENDDSNVSYEVKNATIFACEECPFQTLSIAEGDRHRLHRHQGRWRGRDEHPSHYGLECLACGHECIDSEDKAAHAVEQHIMVSYNRKDKEWQDVIELRY